MLPGSVLSCYLNRNEIPFTALLFILSTIHSTQPDRIGHEGKTALAIKQFIQDYNYSIPVGLNNFKELTRRGKIFIDNTLFCKEILAPYRHRWTIASPDQWGRSTLLTMLKAFLEIEVDENGNSIPKESSYSYNLFKKAQVKHKDGRTEPLTTPLLLADEREIIDNYLGKYPVIYVSFKEVVGKHKIDIEHQVAIAIQRAFKQHKYMVTVIEKYIQNGNPKSRGIYTKEDLADFKNYLNLTEKLLPGLKKVLDRLYFLGKILEKHFGKKCFLLIDDYDTPLHSALKFRKYRKQDERDVYFSFDEFQSFLLIHSRFEKVIEMGMFIVKFNDHYQFQLEDTMFEKNYGNETVRGSPMREYFAFKQAHVKFLFEKSNMTQHFKKAKIWYDGYRCSASEEPFYNPVSIINFLLYKQFANYGPTEGKFTEYFQNELRRDAKRKYRMASLIDREAELGIVRLLFTTKEKYFFEGTMNSRWDLFYHLLRMELRITVNYEQSPTHALPNYESSLMISKWLINYYVQKYQINERLLNDTAIALNDFILSEGTNKSFSKFWQHLYNNNLQQANETESMPNPQDPIMILHCVALQMKCTSHFQIDVSLKDHLLDTLSSYFHEKKQGVVIALERNISTIGSAYTMAQRGVTRLRNVFSEVQMALIVVIDIIPNQPVRISSKSINV